MTDINYDTFAEEYFELLTESYRNSLGKAPLAIYTMGIPASGKSSSVKYILPRLNVKKDEIVELDPDEIMMRFPNYTKNINKSLLTTLNKTAVIIASKVLGKLIESKISFVYYGTGKSFSSYRGMLNKTKKAGYLNGLISVILGSDEAIIRNSVRERSVGPSVIKDISRSLKSGLNAPKYAKGKTPFEALRDLEFVDFVFEIDTASKPPIVDLIKSTDEIVIKSNSAKSNSAKSNKKSNKKSNSVKSNKRRNSVKNK